MRTILGVSALYHDSAVALVRDGDIVAAAQEERFTRRKHDARFPQLALQYCLEQAGGAGAIDAIAYYEDPVLAFDRVLKNAVETAPASGQIWPAAAVSQLRHKLEVFGHLAASASGRLFAVDHHMSHAASTFYPSPFSRAAIVTVDGVGEWATTAIACGDGRTITPLHEIDYPHSLGMLYSAFTYHCGLKVNSGEYKLMGLAPYGEPRFAQTILDRVIDLRPDGSFHLNTDYFGFLTTDRATSPAFDELFGCPRREPEGPLTQVHMDLAASIQAVLDESMQRVCRYALASTGMRDLCLAGGVALNCVSNGRLLRALPELDDLWIQPAAGDAGGALGAALYVAHTVAAAPRHSGVGRADGQHGSFLGPEYGLEEIEDALNGAGLRARFYDSITERDADLAEALDEGLIVARFDGRMEFGPRALGNRSILADPRRLDGQAHVNLRIKFRESWRPFAPAVLAEHADAYFALRAESPYMLLVGDLKDHLRQQVDWSGFRAGDTDMLKVLNQPRSTVPAITHVDYSARVQTVDARRNPGFHALLSAFYVRTGCPLLVNTSFNVRGEPIVCTPSDAAACFINTGIDVLAAGPFLAFKSEQSSDIREREGEVVFELD